ncbi:MAG: glycosyltransferase family 4 protein [Chthoniobacter sp.]
MVRRGIPVEVISMEIENPLSADFQRQAIPLLCLDERRVIYEDRIRKVLQRLAAFHPTAVVSTLGAVSFETLRYLPPGVFRVGMGQSDDPQVYEMMRRYGPWMDLVAMVSQAMQQKAQAMPDFARVPVGYLPYGVPMCPATELPMRPLTQPLRILYLGRLDREQKRVHLFPEILRHLVAGGAPFRWTIVGEGPERAFLEANLKTDSPSQTVTFAGAIHYADVSRILRDHDVFLLASDYEGLPLSLLEAMGYGLVPVVTDLASGIREVVDAASGFRIPVDDVAGYARAILHLHQHRDEFAAKSAAARARVAQDFSVAAMTDRWLAAIPATAAGGEAWSNHWRITAPLEVSGAFHFSPPMRLVRRLAKRLQTFCK